MQRGFFLKLNLGKNTRHAQNRKQKMIHDSSKIRSQLLGGRSELTTDLLKTIQHVAKRYPAAYIAGDTIVKKPRNVNTESEERCEKPRVITILLQTVRKV